MKDEVRILRQYFDVTFYNIALFVNPADSSIQGSVIVHASIVQPVDVFVLDLDTLLDVTSVEELVEGQSVIKSYYHTDGKIWIDLESTRQPKERISIRIHYGGKPRVARD